MRCRTFLIVCGSLVVLCHPLWFSTAKSVENSRDPDEQLLEDTGIGSDEASLLDYLGKLSGTGSKPLDDLIRQLGSARLEERTQAAQGILRLGYGAISALRESFTGMHPGDRAQMEHRIGFCRRPPPGQASFRSWLASARAVSSASAGRATGGRELVCPGCCCSRSAKAKRGPGRSSARPDAGASRYRCLHCRSSWFGEAAAGGASAARGSDRHGPSQGSARAACRTGQDSDSHADRLNPRIACRGSLAGRRTAALGRRG